MGPNNEAAYTRLDRQVEVNATLGARLVYLAPAECQVVAISERHSVVGGAAATVTLEKLTGTQAPGAGTEIATPLSLTSAINTTATGVLASTAICTLQAGEALAVKVGGTIGTPLGVLSFSVVLL